MAPDLLEPLDPAGEEAALVALELAELVVVLPLVIVVPDVYCANVGCV